MSSVEAASVNLSTDELAALTRSIFGATMAQLANPDLKPSGLAACVNSLKTVAVMAERIDQRIEAEKPVQYFGPKPGSLSHYKDVVDALPVS